MVGAAALYRCARRSLDGLVAFMRSYCPDDEKTLRCLAANGADLSAAVRMATGGELFGAGASPRVRDAFESAAKAARHPDPAMFARFSEALMGPDPGAATVRFVLMLACSTGTLSPATIDTISAALRRLMHGRVHTPPLPAPQLSRGAQRAVGHTTDAFMERQASMATIVVGVGLALQKHAMQTGEALSLHLIYGASRFRRGREIVYHINFLATKGMFEAPTLFFAEFNALVRDAASDVTLCRRVPASQGPGGCEACEFVGGQRLVHPAGEEFKGRVIEFAPGEESLKKHPDNEIFGGPLDEDYVFFDAGLHPEMACFLEDRYSAMDDDHVDLTFMRF
ncbi:hypothetical protein QOZ80_7AG0580030 [Eleusine coracana subsp. coracana]|nr:hypothetical protein QOZ80_7AG0580030 [Eleusine coracana subsp. coracana]